MSEQIVKAEFSDVMQKSYIDYAMSVICQRALPDVRDGLKPVQRRVLFAMSELGLNYDKPHRKSARIVGDTMGKYHPHGDSSIYEALVVLEQDFKKGMALVDGHGNFGSIEGDGAAAMRYTEAKLKKFTQDVYLSDLDKNVVDFIPNFDETEKEPEVLPVRVPNLLINGAEGIAVGMTTNIPPHNLIEVIGAMEAYMDDPDITVKELMNYIPGPDFPTGGEVVNKKDLLSIYETGTGKIRLRGKVDLEPGKRKTDRDKLVISEIPYTMIGANIGKFIGEIFNLIETKQTTDITDVSNESSKEGIRIVLELKRNADVEQLKNLLYKKTRLEDTFGVNMLAIAEGRPETLSLKDVISYHMKFQYQLNQRKYTTLLNKELEQKEIKEGLIKACDMIDLIIEIIRGSKSLKEVKACLVSGETGNIHFRTKKSKMEAAKLRFTERQATAILDLRLYRLIGLEVLALKQEYEEILAKIARYEEILSNPDAMAQVIKDDLERIRLEYGLPRKTVIKDAKAVVLVQKPVEELDVYFLMDRFGYVRLIDEATMERNRETVEKEEKYMIPCQNLDRICIFTKEGTMHQLKLLDVPMGRLRDKGTPVDNLCNYDSSKETIAEMFPARDMIGRKLLFVTAKGMVKQVEAEEFFVTKRSILATKLGEEDYVEEIILLSHETEGQDSTIVLQSVNGYFLRFPLSQISIKKKGAVGIRGMRLSEDDRIRQVYLPEANHLEEIMYKEKELNLKRLKLAARDGKGTKLRR
ncbi:MAG: DNA topoisomerase (ATP-hydrolyzing) [Lachnospiraceae bacterium]|nr:DNA topoisomerase (ATP-hydrolyzing) [Lachnospiraceae bacterium]